MQEDILTFTLPETKWLSNMQEVVIPYGKLLFPSTENAYQAMKYLPTDLIDVNGKLINRRYYISTLKPNASKFYSLQNPLTNPDFMKKRVEIMRYFNKIKYNNPLLKARLLSTGNCHLEEGNWWEDHFWGVDIKTRKGQNMLGKILMEIRAELYEEFKHDQSHS